MSELRRLHPRNWNPRLIWDVVMVWIALINLGLILFDLTYLMLRPQYLRFVSPVTRIYDPVLGITPHPLTEELLQDTAELRQLLALDPDAPGLRTRVAELRELTLRVLEEDPFQRSGQSRTLEVMRLVVRQETGPAAAVAERPAPLSDAVHSFWTSEPARLSANLQLFDSRLRPLLARNYFRELTLEGRLVDHFWLIDLPFLSFFLLEFGARWALAVRHRRYARWFFFPIFNWYDLIGLIPYTQFRIFRLLRLASIYMRLRRSELSRIGRDTLSRAVAYVSNIIAEEISDSVSLRILNETQTEIREGTARRIFDEAVADRRGELERMAVAQIRDVVTGERTQQRVRALLRLHLDAAVEESEALQSVPLPNAVLRPIVRSTGEAVVESILQGLTSTLQSEEGQRAARELVGSVLDDLLSGPWRREIDALSSDISLDVIERMKEAVAVKKWALPEPPVEVLRDPAKPGT